MSLPGAGVFAPRTRFPLQLAAGGVERGASTCLLDGFLFEPERLASALGLPDSSSEERLVVAGFARWGSELPKHLDGEFVVFAWDDERQRGLIAVDRLGVGPIFLCSSGGVLHFASEIGGLLSALPRSPDPDEEAVAQALSGWTLDGDRTMYRGISRLGAAGLVELDRAGFSVDRYWRPSLPKPISTSRQEASEEIRRLLGVAIRRRTRPGERVGVLLSGGLDSSAVAAVGAGALAAGGSEPACFSARFPDLPEADESAQLRALEPKLGLPCTVLDAGAGSALAGGIEFLVRWQVPLGPPNHFAWQPLLRRAAGQGVVTMLDGNGGDEVFSAAPALIADRLAGLRFGVALRLASRLAGPTGPRGTAAALHRFGLRGLPARRGQNGDGPRWWAQRRAAVFELPQSFGARDYARRAAASAGLVARHPLEDLDLVEFVGALPPEWSFDRRFDRPLLREATRGLVPDEIRLRTRKATFDRLFRRSLLGSDLALIRELLDDRNAEVRRWLPAGVRGDDALALWRAANLELWLRSHQDPACLQGFLERITAPDSQARTFFSLENPPRSATL